MTTQTRVDIIRERLTTALQPTQLDILDQSAQHAGHAGARDGGGHYSITIASPIFEGKTLVACHRLIYAALGELMQQEIHALQINIKK